MQFCLISKDPKRLKDGVLVLGLEVREECNTLRWKRGSPVPELPSVFIFTNPSAWVGYDTRSIFKLSLTGLDSEFSFS